MKNEKRLGYILATTMHILLTILRISFVQLQERLLLNAENKKLADMEKFMSVQQRTV